MASASPSSSVPVMGWRGLLLAVVVTVAAAATAAPGESTEAHTPAASDRPAIADGAGDSGDDEGTEAPAESAPEAGPSPEVFVPSEDISEDFAVPFPVDI